MRQQSRKTSHTTLLTLHRIAALCLCVLGLLRVSSRASSLAPSSYSDIGWSYVTPFKPPRSEWHQSVLGGAASFSLAEVEVWEAPVDFVPPPPANSEFGDEDDAPTIHASGASDA